MVDLEAASHHDVIGRDLAGASVRCNSDLKQAVFEILFGVAADHPTWARRVDDTMVRLRGSTAPEVDELLGVVRALENLDVSLERLLPDVRGPHHDLRLLPRGVNLKGADGSALVVDG